MRALADTNGALARNPFVSVKLPFRKAGISGSRRNTAVMVDGRVIVP
ncbi:hypothetical protein [Bifidobacterium catulorum]|nr:hypothetical protein [Bifidobacterium catulorum]